MKLNAYYHKTIFSRKTFSRKCHCLSFCQIYISFSGTLFQGETIWPKSFDQKGLILVRCKDSDPLSFTPEEKLFELGVESFERELDVEGVEYWKVSFCISIY